MLNVNNVSPSIINLTQNSSTSSITSINVSSGGTSSVVWAKPFTLSITNGTGYALYVERTSSPFGAVLGNLSNGATIYANDRLRISYGVSSGYQVTQMIINSVSYVGLAVENYLVSSNVAVSAVVSSGITWHTIFSGSFESSHQSSTTKTSYSAYFSGLRAGVQTRVTGQLLKESSTVLSTFTQKTLPYQYSYNKVYQGITGTINNYLQFYLQRPSPAAFYKAPFFRITKIEQYY